MVYQITLLDGVINTELVGARVLQRGYYTAHSLSETANWTSLMTKSYRLVELILCKCKNRFIPQLQRIVKYRTKNASDSILHWSLNSMCETTQRDVPLIVQTLHSERGPRGRGQRCW